MVALMTVLAAYPAAADPPVGGDLVLVVEQEVEVVKRAVAEQGPWLPLAGGTMEGDIEMQDHRVWFGNSSLLKDGVSNTLLFGEKYVCLADSPLPGCAAAGDIAAVRAGFGLLGGGDAGEVGLAANPAVLQQRVGGLCAPGFAIRAIGDTGAVTCEEDTDTDTVGALACAVGQVAKRGSSAWACGSDEDTTYTAGAGLALTATQFYIPDQAIVTGMLWNGAVTSEKLQDGTIVAADIDRDEVQRRVSGTCAAGSSIREVRADGTVGCEADDDTTYTPGDGLSLSGTTFAVRDCAPSQVLKGDSSGAWACGSDADTTYAAGAGLRLAGTTFRVMDCAADEVLKAAGPGSWSCARDEVGTGDITGVTAGAGLTGGGASGDVTLRLAAPTSSALGGVLAGSCAGTQKAAGIDTTGALTCAADQDTTYSAGDGLRLSGAAFAVLDCAANEVLKGNATGAWACGRDDDTTYSAGAGLQLGGARFSVVDCLADQVLKATGPGSWSCGSDEDTTYTAGDGLSLIGTSFRVMDCAANQVLQRNAADTAWACDRDDDTTYSAGSGLALTGTTFSIPTGGVTGAMVQDDDLRAADLRDEPGASAGPRSGPITVGTNDTVLAKANATFPAAGFLVLSAQAIFENNLASDDNFLTATLYQDGARMDTWTWDAGDDDGHIDWHQGFVIKGNCEEGFHEYELRVRQSSGSATADKAQIILQYFPTSY